VLFIVLFERRSDPTDKADELAKRAFPEFSGRKNEADAIEIIRGAERVVFVKRDAGASGKHWQITQPIDYRADDSRVIGLLDAFERAERKEMAEGVSEKRLTPTADVEQYRLDKAVHVIISAGKERLLDCLVGGATASKGSVYVSRASREAVYAVADELRDEVLRHVNEFRDKRLVDLAKGLVTGFTILEEGKPTAEVARKRGGRWRVVSPLVDRADRQKVQQILDRMGKLWADRFAADFTPDYPHRAKKMAAYGLLPAKRSIKVAVELAGKTIQHEILFGKKVKKEETNQAPSWDVYAMVAGSGTVVLVPKQSMDLIDVTVDGLRDRNVVDFSTDEVAAVSVKRAAGELRFERKDAGWRLGAPAEEAGRAASRDGVRELLEALTGLRVRKFLPADARLETPIGVEIAFKEPEKKEGEETGGGEAPQKRQSESVFFGTRRSRAAPPGPGDGGAGTGETIRARRGKAGAVFEVPAAIIGKLEAQPFRFYEKKVLMFDQAKLSRLSITAGGRTDSVVRKGGAWELEGEGELDPSRADDIKWALCELEVEEFVAKIKGADLESFGLAPAAIRVVARVEPEARGGEASRHVLLVGRLKPKEDAKDADRRYYARLAEGDVIFLLKQKLVKDLRAGLLKKAKQQEKESTKGG
ncbi:MAG: DUF4340 domain-containing protein, partial [Planctomycetota bacterium]|jgi:hypothetical protein